MSELIESEGGEYSAHFVGDVLIICGHGGTRAITWDELDEMLTTDNPVTVR